MPLNPIGWLVVIALIAGIAWAWQRYDDRQKRFDSDEKRCQAERKRQQERALTIVNQRPRR